MNSAFQFHSNPFSLIEGDSGARFDEFQGRFARGRTDLIHSPLRLSSDGERGEIYPKRTMTGVLGELDFPSTSIARRLH